jgi:ABC-type Fe3+-hydroxamate transport system substrate-binding protein
MRTSRPTSPDGGVPRRIVSLCPSITETLIRLGAGDRIAGVTRYCTRPASAVRAIRKVGGTKSPDLAAIREINPDRIFANLEENRDEDLRELRREFSIHESVPRTVGEIPNLVRRFGQDSGCREKAEEMAEEIENAIAASPPPGKPIFRYVYFIWRSPWMTVSGDTYVSDLFRYAGGQNAFSGAKTRYPKVTALDVRASRPDVLVFPSEPYHFSERQLPALRRELESAVPAEFVDGDDCCWHGARTIEGLELMRSLREQFAND